MPPPMDGPDNRRGFPPAGAAPGAATGTDKEREEKRKKRTAGRRIVEQKAQAVWNPRRGTVEEEASPRMRRAGRKGGKKGKGLKGNLTSLKAAKRVVRIEDTITVGDLAQALSVKSGELIGALMKQGVMARITDVLDFETASLIADEFEYKIENVAFDVSDYVPDVSESDEDQVPRSPVVTVMGHVDHGKTSLLDYIRRTRVAAGEAGGITQHIGAYAVDVNGRKVVFLDTPGHEAFTEMRARGAQVTDIVILVVAADDGVMPQTVEAIAHARAANVPLVVALTKIDKNNARPDHVMRQLAEKDLTPEAWGGTTPVMPVSSHTGSGIAELLEILVLQADILQLTANPNRPATGVVIEARLDRGRGPVANVIVQSGTLRVGDYVVTGQVYGRVRAMMDDSGKNTVREAGPASPVQILGLNGVPNASDTILVVDDEKKARTIAEHRAAKEREKELGKTSRVSLEDLYEQIKTGDVQELRLIVKADVQGSAEALKSTLAGIQHAQVQLKVIYDAVGGITDSDVNLAKASGAVIIGFNVRAETSAKAIAEQEGVEIKNYSVIYDVVDDVKKSMQGLLAPTIEERDIGRVEIRQIISVPKQGNIAGCYVVNGIVRRNARCRLYRDNKLLWTGGIGSLRRFKNDAKEVAEGYECGIRLDGYQDIKEGDVLEVFETISVAQTFE
jgi:translation initiation factor IF-2